MSRPPAPPRPSGSPLRAAGRPPVRYPAAGPLLGVGRSLLALAQLLTLLFTSDAELFPGGPRCGGGRLLTLWCLGPPGGAPGARRVLAVLGLLLVISGWLPRWTAVLHWYLTFGLTGTMAVADAGDMAARIGTLLLLPLLLGDPRRWIWTGRLRPPVPAWRGAGRAALLLLRVQVLIVYAQAAGSKLLDPLWRDGTALYYWLHSHYWGLAPALRPLLDPVLANGWSVRALTWTVIVLELGIAGCMLAPGRPRRAAVPAAVLLHGGIALCMGLPGFALTMVGLVLLACADIGPLGPRWRPMHIRCNRAAD
ncbi:sporulation-delaying protein SdpB family protein [Kitasatospora sp. NPDC094015]|uniref:sporulation-delaying protein SdpB family protein n=1 Tax=Kitasatospora sp. NPDC094015 TaxID=3155205 RepID=UPI00332A7CBE